MNQSPLVLILGESFLMNGIEAGLQNVPTLQVIRIGNLSSDLDHRVKTLNPKTIIFELDEISKFIIFSLLVAQPGVLFIGVDNSANEAVALKCHFCHDVNMKGLSQLIHTELGCEACAGKGENEKLMMDTH